MTFGLLSQSRNKAYCCVFAYSKLNPNEITLFNRMGCDGRVTDLVFSLYVEFVADVASREALVLVALGCAVIFT